MQTIIAFDAKRIVRNNTGLGNYCRTLVNDLAQVIPHNWQLQLYAPDKGHDSLRQQIHPSPQIQFLYPPKHPLPLPKALWRIKTIVNQLKQQHVSLYHGLTGELPLAIHQAQISTVVTIHDLIFMRHPEYYNPIDAKIYQWKFRNACQQADHIIAISNRTKLDIIELGHVSEDKISVIYQSCAPRFTTTSQAPPLQEFAHTPFILSVGTIEERKNIALAVNALHYLPQNIHLVAVGKTTKYAQKLLRQISNTTLAPRVHFLNNVSDQTLHTLYRDAQVFVYPSRYEGFGIPIIEAISSGLPVVAATGSCLEEAGGPHSLYVSPDDPQALAAAIQTLLPPSPQRQQRIHLSRQYITRFHPDNLATQILNLYHQLLHKP